jgi:hypothetical protein
VAKQPKRQYCWWCGEELGVFIAWGPRITCGKIECEREARYDEQAERQEAHEQLDRDMGW